MDAQRLIQSELACELLAARLIANLATLNPDGSVHLVAMWFLWEDAVLFPTSGRSQKARNVARDPRASVMIDDSRGGLDVRGVTFAGQAEILRGKEAALINSRIHRKYLTEAAFELDPVAEAVRHDDVTIRFVPERGRMWDLSGYEATRLVQQRGDFEPLLPVHSK